MTRAIIVDDEEKGRETLHLFIKNYCPEVEVVAITENITDARAAIIELRPDLLFLDIEMPNGNGFDLLERFKEINFDIIFTTAYDHYALKAIRHSALDYLLKPISVAELQRAIQKHLQRRNEEKDHLKKLSTLIKNIRSDAGLKKISIPDVGGFVFIDKEEIIRCESDNSYTVLYLKEGKIIVSTRALKDYEDLLKDDNFFRIHTSHLVNLNQVKRYEKGEGGSLIMIDGSVVEVSRRRKSSLLERLEQKTQ